MLILFDKSNNSTIYFLFIVVKTSKILSQSTAAKATFHVNNKDANIHK